MTVNNTTVPEGAAVVQRRLDKDNNEECADEQEMATADRGDGSCSDGLTIRGDLGVAQFQGGGRSRKHVGLLPSWLLVDALRSWVRRRLGRFREALKKSIAKKGSLAPVVELLGGTQLEASLMAFLPLYTGLKTGNMIADMFFVTLAVRVVMAVVRSVGRKAKELIDNDGPKKGKGSASPISVMIEYHQQGQFGQVTRNVHWTAMAWLISRLSSEQKTGEFRMVPFETEPARRPGTGDVPRFNVLPRGDDKLTIEYEGAKIVAQFMKSKEEDTGDSELGGKGGGRARSLLNRQPPIVVWRRDGRYDSDEPANLAWMQRFLVRVTAAYYAEEERRRTRARYERLPSYWKRVQTLHASRGLAHVALDRTQEELLLSDLETFHGDAEFYKRMGLPYKRGYLFSGRPGTGKTTLINAISATYNRDLYYLNLRDMDDDSELQAAFSSVPENSILVFEDIDAQSGEVHSRERRFEMRRVERLRAAQERAASRAKRKKEKAKALKKKQAEERKKKQEKNGGGGDVASDAEEDTADDSSEEEEAGLLSGDDYESDPGQARSSSFLGGGGDFGLLGGGGGGEGGFFSGFTLSALLNCLDGHMMNENIIVIMTSNHPEVLDAALIRPGRIDLHLELGYCTQHQIQRMYASVIDPTGAGAVIGGKGDALPELTFPGGPGAFPEGVLAPCDALRIMVLYRSVPELIPGRLAERAHAVRAGRRDGGLRAGQGGIQAASQLAQQQIQQVLQEVVSTTSAAESSGAETASAPSTVNGSAPGSPLAGGAAQLSTDARASKEHPAL
ncbi:hypothetical protein HK405_008796 [Cladochytrium tenue]|nr:hypothetical protein HK405_008796 [Cladochytrium tenue]